MKYVIPIHFQDDLKHQFAYKVPRHYSMSQQLDNMQLI